MLEKLFSITDVGIIRTVRILGMKFEFLNSIEFAKNVFRTIRSTTVLDYLPKLYIPVAEHCNDNCYGCWTFSTLAKEEFYDIKTFEQDINRLSELTSLTSEGGGGATPYTGEVTLAGGEPLLNPNIISFFELSRRAFPDPSVKIVLITNGLLLLKQKAPFFKAVLDNNITISPTKYPDMDWNKIEQYVESFGVTLQYSTDMGFQSGPVSNKNERVSGKMPLHLDGKCSLTPFDSYSRCGLSNGACSVMRNGKLYPCSIIAGIRHFNSHFNQNLPVSSHDYMDIYKVANCKEILEYMAKPHPFCKYCNVAGRVASFGEYRKTTHSISEWTT
ncbi:hypothetical protein RsTz2092_02250 [Deferribacterales bacterium RsTz2092]|nr:hypothetical protein AGMMS49941_01380 [Deferribacterales bacterium]